ncbi:MAG: response regulator [Syntrophorhabdaceae bacterium]
MNALQTRVVLVVDDEAMLEEYIQAVLHAHGYASRSFTEPVKALEFFRQHPDDVDLIITDVKMPAIDGLELAQEAAKIKPDIPIIFVSSDGEKLNQAKTIGGTRACFFKPVSRKDLTNCVESVIGRSPAP